MNFRNLFFWLLIIMIAKVTYAQSEGQWRTIYKYSGTANESTDDFTINSDRWRIVWEADKQYQDLHGGNLAIYLVYPNGDEDFIANTLPTNSGKTIIRKKGTFYFKISSLFVKWKIEVQEFIENKK